MSRLSQTRHNRRPDLTTRAHETDISFGVAKGIGLMTTGAAGQEGITYLKIVH